MKHTKLFIRLLAWVILLYDHNILFAQREFWIQTGGPHGGLVNALAMNSEGSVFAGTQGAGIFRSIDNGAAWTPASTGLVDAVIHAVALNSNGFLFAGTNSGVFRSQDNGETWIYTALTNSVVYALVVGANGYVFAGTFGNGVFRSTNNGTTWTQTNVGLTNTDVRSLAGDSSGFIFAGTYGDGAFRSTDDGITWNQINAGLISPYVLSLAIGADHQVLAGTASGIFRSLDNGENWLTSLSSVYVQAIGVSSNGDIFAATGAAIYQSVNNGASWTSIVGSPVAHTLAINSSGHVFAGTDGGGVFRSTDAGGNWIQVNTGLTAHHVFSLALNSDDHIFAGTWQGGVFRSNNDGNSWAKLSLSSQLVVYDLLIDSSAHMFAGTNGGIFRSTDDGATWIEGSIGLTNALVLTLVRSTDGQLFAGTGNVFEGSGGVYSSTNKGESWIQTGLNNSHVFTLVVDHSGNILAGTQGTGVFRSDDNGVTWAPTGLNNADVNTIAINSGGNVFAGTYGAGVFRSDDNGVTWAQTSLNSGHVFALAVDANGHIIAGIPGGIYRSSDNGGSWTQISSGLTNITSTSTARSFALNSQGHLFVAMAGNAVFRSALSTFPPHITMDKSSLVFEADSGTTQPTSQTVSITNSGGGTFNWTITRKESWLVANLSGGGIDEGTRVDVSINVNTSDFDPGTYVDTLIVLGNADNAPQRIPVSYTVHARSRISLSTKSISFVADTGHTKPGHQIFSVSNQGDGTLQWTIHTAQSWVSVTPDTGTGDSSNITVSILTTDLAPGIYRDTITVTGLKTETGSSATNSPQRIVVTYTVDTRAQISLDRFLMSFAADSALTHPAPQTLAISNTGGGTLQWTVSKTQSWLAVGPDTGTGNNATITLDILTTDLAPGTYHDTVRVAGGKIETGSDAVNTPQTLRVTYSVGARAVFVLDKATMNFVADSASSPPAGQSIMITNVGGGILRWNAVKTQPWISVSPDSGTTETDNQDTLAVNITTTNLLPDIYIDTLTLTSAMALNTPQVIIVTYEVLANNAPTRFVCIRPAGGDTLNLTVPAKPVKFIWQKAGDLDAGDTVSYSFYLLGIDYDTTIASINDTSISFNIMEGLSARTVYSWWVLATDGVLATPSDTALFVTSATVTGVNENSAQLPDTYRLFQNYPNPFNPTTTIEYHVPLAGPVRLCVFDILGREIAVLVDEIKAVGKYTTVFNAGNLHTGTYFCRMLGGSFLETRKLILLK